VKAHWVLLAKVNLGVQPLQRGHQSFGKSAAVSRLGASLLCWTVSEVKCFSKCFDAL